ncbi:MAG: pilus assembly protein PilP [Acidiferrobacterales bacterium]
MKFRNALLIGIIAASVTGCGGDGMSDLRDFVKNAYADRKPKVEPLPQIKPAQSFAYSAGSLTDPFSTLNLKPQSMQQGGLRPDMNRRKEPLENYPLDSLKMVGTISRGNQFWAVIQAPDGTVHRVQVGNHMGQNFGLVTKITEEKIRITELIQGPTGDWVEREASLALAE